MLTSVIVLVLAQSSESSDFAEVRVCQVMMLLWQHASSDVFTALVREEIEAVEESILG